MLPKRPMMLYVSLGLVMLTTLLGAVCHYFYLEAMFARSPGSAGLMEGLGKLGIAAMAFGGGGFWLSVTGVFCWLAWTGRNWARITILIFMGMIVMAGGPMKILMAFALDRHALMGAYLVVWLLEMAAFACLLLPACNRWYREVKQAAAQAGSDAKADSQSEPV